MKAELVRYEVDLDNLPPLTAEQAAELRALAAMPDETIDYSDIPPLTDAFWDNAVQGRFHRPPSTSTTLDLDSDVLAWLETEGADVAPRVNAILRRAMRAAREEG